MSAVLVRGLRTVPTLVELGIVFAFGVIALLLATRAFAKSE